MFFLSIIYNATKTIMTTIVNREYISVELIKEFDCKKYSRIPNIRIASATAILVINQNVLSLGTFLTHYLPMFSIKINYF